MEDLRWGNVLITLPFKSTHTAEIVVEQTYLLVEHIINDRLDPYMCEFDLNGRRKNIYHECKPKPLQPVQRRFNNQEHRNEACYQ